MATIDYSNYLEQQNQWVTSLVQLARDSEPEKARELVEIIADSLHRMLDLSWSHSRSFPLPAGHYTGPRQEPADDAELPRVAGVNN